MRLPIQSDSDLLRLKEDYIIFIDESGDDTFYEDSSMYDDTSISPCLTILALIIRKEHYVHLIEKVKVIKQSLFNSEEVIFVSRNIRNKVGAFKSFQDDEIYTIFKDLIIDAIDSSNALIVSCSINKNQLLRRKESIEKYSGQQYVIDPLYETCCKFMFERVCHFLQGERATAHFCFEKIGKKESRKMERFIENLKREGSITMTKRFTFGFKKEHYRPVISYSFPSKSLNIAGTQIADYCAHPFSKRCRYRYSEVVRENNLFTLLRNYIYQGDKYEYGLKEWP